MTMRFGKQHPWDRLKLNTFYFWWLQLLLQAQTSFFCFFRFLICFKRSLHVHSMRLVETIKNTDFVVYYALYLRSCYSDRELFFATFAVIFLSLLWTALKLKIKPKRICSCKCFGLSVFYQWKEVQNITTECLVRTTSCYCLTSTE